MSEKTDLIVDVVRKAKNISREYRELNHLTDVYKDRTWTVGGANEITQDDITEAGYAFTPADLKAVVDTTAEAINLLMTGGSPSTGIDYDKKLNLIITGQG